MANDKLKNFIKEEVLKMHKKSVLMEQKTKIERELSLLNEGGTTAKGMKYICKSSDIDDIDSKPGSLAAKYFKDKDGKFWKSATTLGAKQDKLLVMPVTNKKVKDKLKILKESIENPEIVSDQRVTGGMTPTIRHTFNDGTTVDTKGNGNFIVNNRTLPEEYYTNKVDEY